MLIDTVLQLSGLVQGRSLVNQLQYVDLETKLNEISRDLLNPPLVEHEFHSWVDSICNFWDAIQDSDGIADGRKQFELHHHKTPGVSAPAMALDCEA
jgi:hypothetical protein